MAEQPGVRLVLLVQQERTLKLLWCRGGGQESCTAHGLRWPGRSRSRAMSFERFRRCAQDTKAVKLRAMTQLAVRP